MSNKPVAKFWGNIKKKELDEVLALPNSVTTHEKYGDQIMIQAAQWDSGNISVQFWDKETNKNIDVLVLRPQKDGTYQAQSVDINVTSEDESPF